MLRPDERRVRSLRNPYSRAIRRCDPRSATPPVAEILKPATDRPAPENQVFSCRMSLSQVVKRLRHDLRQGEAVSRQPDSDARMFIGYARVSTRGQDLDAQRAALGAAGCVRIFEEKASGAKRDRPELARMLDHLRAGDVVTITRLDRLARSTADLLNIAERIKEAGAGLRSLAEPWADRGRLREGAESYAKVSAIGIRR